MWLKWENMGMEKYGKWRMEEKGKRERREDNDNYYLLRMILNKRFCFCIHFFKIDIHYIDKCSIERKCIPYIPEYGKA